MTALHSIADYIAHRLKRRFLIRDLAVRGKLVPQDPGEESAAELLKRIKLKRENLIDEGKIKKSKPQLSIDNEECLFELPLGWVWARFGDAVFNRDAERIPVSSADRKLRKGEYDYYGASGVIDKIDDYLFDTPLLLIGEDGANLINRSTPIAFMARGKYWVNNHAHVIDGISEIVLRYIDLYINSIDLRPYVTGTAQPKMNQAKLNSIVIALPSEAEMRCVVAKVDELMALCDALEEESTESIAAHQALVENLLATLTISTDADDLVANWTRIETHFDTLFTTEASIDHLKQTILQLAVMGKLVQQDSADEPTAEILTRLREKSKYTARRKARPAAEAKEEVFPFESPNGWMWTTVQEILDPHREISYGVIKLGAEPMSGGVTTLRCSNVRPGFIDLSGVRQVHESIEAEYARTRLLGGEVLINIRGTLGGVALVPDELKGFNVAREVAVVPFAQDIFAPFMVHLMLSPFFWGHIQSNLRGIAYKGLNLGILRGLPIPIPPVAEQHRIVAKVDELIALCNVLKANLEMADSSQRQFADAMIIQATVQVN